MQNRNNNPRPAKKRDSAISDQTGGGALNAPKSVHDAYALLLKIIRGYERGKDCKGKYDRAVSASPQGTLASLIWSAWEANSKEIDGYLKDLERLYPKVRVEYLKWKPESVKKGEFQIDQIFLEDKREKPWRAVRQEMEEFFADFSNGAIPLAGKFTPVLTKVKEGEEATTVQKERIVEALKTEYSREEQAVKAGYKSISGLRKAAKRLGIVIPTRTPGKRPMHKP